MQVAAAKIHFLESLVRIELMESIVCPSYYQIYHQQGASWFVKDPVRMFYNPTNTPTDPAELKYIECQYGLTAHQVAIELFRINGGKPGYYLANLRERSYYYCGLNWEDIRLTLQQLGIGKPEPN